MCLCVYLLITACMSTSCEVDTNQEQSDEGTGESSPRAWAIEASFPNEGTVMSIWGVNEIENGSSERVWAVGGQPDKGIMWERQDDVWNEVDLPAGPLLNWVHGTAGHLWVVGNEGRALRYIDPESGGTGEWEVFEADTTQDLWGVFAVSPNEVWAVGGNPIGMDHPDPVLSRFDGNIWTRVELPEPDRSGVRALFKIYQDPLSEAIFAVGMRGVIYGDLGDGWRQLSISAAGEGPAVTEDFVSLWGSGEGLIAVGGRSNGAIARWDGEEWKSAVLTGVPGLNGVWVDPTGIATVVGVRGAALQIPTTRFEGVRERSGTALVLHATWGTADEIWAVGGSLDHTPPWEGVILNSPR